MRYRFIVEQVYEGAVDKEPPPAFDVARESGTTVVRGAIEVEADTLQEAFAHAVDAFMDAMTDAGWEGVTVVGGIRAENILPNRVTP